MKANTIRAFFEANRVPLTFRRDKDNWINCRAGGIKVRWVSYDRWMICAKGHRMVFTTDAELRSLVQEYILDLGGTV